MEIIELKCTSEQIGIVAPIVRTHVASGCNTMFIATCAPDLDVWRWQVVSVSRSVGQRLIRVIKEDSQHSKKVKVKEKEIT